MIWLKMLPFQRGRLREAADGISVSYFSSQLLTLKNPDENQKYFKFSDWCIGGLSSLELRVRLGIEIRKLYGYRPT